MINLKLSAQILKRTNSQFQMWLFKKDLAETLRFEFQLKGITKKKDDPW